VLLLRFLAHALSLAGINGVGIILVDSRGRFLLNLRGSEPDVRLPGRWAILAGAIEPPETPEQAALREIREEIGHSVARVHLVVSVSWPRPVYLYAAGLPVPPQGIHLGEGIEHRLVTLEEVRTLSPRAPLLGSVLRAFARTAAHQACLQDARQA
jgi:8-oxo-dGTP pyrophosphatase MutT (NUDIX family)